MTACWANSAGDRRREDGVLVPAGDGEVPGRAGKTGTCTGTNIRGHGDEWDPVTWYSGDKEVKLNTGGLGKEESGKVSPRRKDLKSASKNTQGFDNNGKWVWTSGLGESRWDSGSHGIFWRAEVTGR